MAATGIQYYGTGRRKTSTARVFLRPGTGGITINRKPIEQAFPTEALRTQIKQPLAVTETGDKFDVLAAASLLVMPSYYESLSMVALEAWALGKPVLANARCDVLLGQCIRSNAGLYYENAGEFGGAVDAILDSPGLADAMGQRGRRYYADHYDWPVIERKYLDMFARLTATPPAHDMEPLPGFLDRRRRDKPPADAVVASLPSGPVRAAENLLETGA